MLRLRRRRPTALATTSVTGLLAEPARGPAEPAGVVFVHGVRTSSEIWTEQLAHVRAAGHPAVAIDLPGHGSRRDERFTLERAYAVIDEAAASFAPGTPVVVVGMSLGGYTSLAYAANRPDRLAGVVACACSADPRGKPVALYRDVAHVLVGARRRVRALVSTLARTGRPLPPGSLAALQLTGAGHPGDGDDRSARPSWDVVTQVLSELAGRSSRADMRAAGVPVWLVNGSRDHLRLDEKRYLEAVPGTALVVVPGAGHDVNLEAPAAFNAALTRALRDMSRGARLGA
ncbi:alpha/beta fold hydrolase [Oerskovia flava]|uniref:alpha/beta fold hydrolase n=1 Tax=Oerskovia flava TaxID=2986422 RepID=UPI00223FA2A7|nr:alpha/beta hydrolase [Oerskovia sp. JB1-3-2]